MLKAALQTLSLGTLLSCQGEASTPEKQPLAAPVVTISPDGRVVADIRACVKEKFTAPIQSINGPFYEPMHMEAGFTGIEPQQRAAVDAQMAWYLNRHAVESSLDGDSAFDGTAFFTELGSVLKSHATAESEAPYRANWKQYCPGERPLDDFYRSVYFVGPAYGIEGVARCLGVEHRCGDF